MEKKNHGGFWRTPAMSKTIFKIKLITEKQKDQKLDSSETLMVVVVWGVQI